MESRVTVIFNLPWVPEISWGGVRNRFCKKGPVRRNAFVRPPKLKRCTLCFFAKLLTVVWGGLSGAVLEEKLVQKYCKTQQKHTFSLFCLNKTSGFEFWMTKWWNSIGVLHFSKKRRNNFVFLAGSVDYLENGPLILLRFFEHHIWKSLLFTIHIFWIYNPY